MNRTSYPTDLTDEQWKRTENLIPAAKMGGRPRTTEMREILDAIVYLTRGGIAWRLLPHDFPAWSTVYHYFRCFKKDGTWIKIHNSLRDEVRKKDCRETCPSAAIIDSQSVKTTEKKGSVAMTRARKIKGRKRHLAVDTMGMVIGVVVHAADIQDRDGAKLLLQTMIGKFPLLKLIWADGGYAGKLVEWTQKMCNLMLEIVKRTDDMKGFKLLPHRWVVERTFGWLGRYRRLSKDYEELTESSEAFIHIAMINLMLHRLCQG